VRSSEFEAVSTEKGRVRMGQGATGDGKGETRQSRKRRRAVEYQKKKMSTKNQDTSMHTGAHLEPRWGWAGLTRAPECMDEGCMFVRFRES
jgi:hypothetical protein